MNTVAVVLASGTGQRFGKTSLPKHLTLILGVPILNWSIDTIINSNLFSALIVVTSTENLALTKQSINKYFDQNKIPILITEGATDRVESFNLGFKQLIKNRLVDRNSIVALFDANRPFTQKNQLLELHNALQNNACACPARPVVNGVAIASSKRILSVPSKSDLVEFVTPEFLRLDKFDGQLENFLTGHNCFVEFSLSFGLNPITISASEINVKLTYPEDKAFVEALAKQKMLEPPKQLRL